MCTELELYWELGIGLISMFLEVMFYVVWKFPQRQLEIGLPHSLSTYRNRELTGAGGECLNENLVVVDSELLKLAFLFKFMQSVICYIIGYGKGPRSI